jgi:wobble nucleotide-excising tRNase
MAESNNGNGNGVIVGIEVLAERIANLSKKLDEQLVVLKLANDAALTAISVAKSDQVQTVNVAFAASQSAISKTEQSQKESNQKIGALENEVVRLAVTQANQAGKSGGMEKMYGWIIAAIMAIVAVYLALYK